MLTVHRVSRNTVFDRMSARGAHLSSGPGGEALFRTRRSIERGRSSNTFQKHVDIRERSLNIGEGGWREIRETWKK